MSYRQKSLVIIPVALVLFLFVYPQGINGLTDKINRRWSEEMGFTLPYFPVVSFRLGLDLLGGTHLVYEADLSNLVEGQTGGEAMEGVRDVIERRVNIFGVAEPLVQVEGSNRLVVELAGVKDISQAIKLIGETPFLQFKEPRPEGEQKEIAEAQQGGERLDEDPFFVDTSLTGKYLKRAQVSFDQITGGIGEVQVALELNSEGAEIFKVLTEKNLNQPLAIYLDGVIISAPVVQSVIPNGLAVITGNFSLKEARELATRLNAGALPVPIKLISQQTIGASLGEQSLNQSLKAGIYGLILVALFMVLFYRLPGLLAVLALLVYVVIVLAIYKLIPVTLTLAGVAGFILSLGMAVDANVLIFARMREELEQSRSLGTAFSEGFRRAWLSIRDSHLTTLIGAVILYLFTSSLIKGFALTLGIGVVVSLFSAVTVTRSFLGIFIQPLWENRKWLFKAWR